MKGELNNPKTEVRTNTFTHDGVDYDLDYVRRAARLLPRTLVKVDQIDWLLAECEWTSEDAKRHAYLGRPVFIVPWQGRTVVVDGLHRLHRAVKKGLERLPAIWIPEDVMDRARLP